MKRSASSASQFVSASRMSGLNDIHSAGPPAPVAHPVQLSAGQLTGYQRNEFDTSKFTTGLAFRTQSQYDLPSFGLDPDEPIFVTGPYGKGGLQPDYRPFSALSGARAPPSYRPRSANGGRDSSLQWYRPRSLVNLEDDTSSIWSGMGSKPQEFTQVIFNLQSRNLDYTLTCFLCRVWIAEKWLSPRVLYIILVITQKMGFCGEAWLLSCIFQPRVTASSLLDNFPTILTSTET